jgi:hypothetical protein
MPITEVNSPINRPSRSPSLPNPGRPMSPGARSNPDNGKFEQASPGNRPGMDRSMRPDRQPFIQGE